MVEGHAHDVVDLAIKVLSNPAIGVDARGTDLVRAVKYSVASDKLTVATRKENMRRPDDSVVISGISESSLSEILTRHARFRKWTAEGETEGRNCPVEISRMVLDRKGDGWETIPRLRGIIHAPTLRPTGAVIPEPGYDSRTGLLFVSDRLWPKQPASPTGRDASRALEVLAEPLAAFLLSATPTAQPPSHY